MSKTGCQCDPDLKRDWGCDSPAQQAVWRDLDEDDYYSCPIRYITEHTVEWFSEYAYYQGFQTSPGKYGEMPTKWLEAVLIYKKALADYTEASRPKPVDRTAALKAGVANRGN